MLNKLLQKAKNADSRFWKWVLAGFIALLVFFVLWRIKKMKDKIAKLEADRDLFNEQVKDMKNTALTEKNVELAKVLMEEANKLEQGVLERTVGLENAKREYSQALNAVNDAKTWAELRRLAGRK